MVKELKRYFIFIILLNIIFTGSLLFIFHKLDTKIIELKNEVRHVKMDYQFLKYNEDELNEINE